MRDKNLTDLEHCNYDIERLLKDNNCYITFDKEIGKIVVVDRDAKKFEQLACNMKLGDT